MRRGAAAPASASAAGAKSDRPLSRGLAAAMDWLMAHPDRFHDYAFGVFRQLGANFQLLAAHLNWLADRGANDLTVQPSPPRRFPPPPRRCSSRWRASPAARRFDPCDALFDTLEHDYETVMAGSRRRWTGLTPTARRHSASRLIIARVARRGEQCRSCHGIAGPAAVGGWECARTRSRRRRRPRNSCPTWIGSLLPFPGPIATALRAAGEWNGTVPLLNSISTTSGIARSSPAAAMRSCNSKASPQSPKSG